MLLNPNLPNAPHPSPDAVPARTRNPRPQTPSSATAGFSYTVPSSGTDDVRAQWKGNEGVIVTFTDKKSGEVVRQIPSEQVLSVARFIRKVLDEAETSKSRTNLSR
jgi:hypothetical protein